MLLQQLLLEVGRAHSRAQADDCGSADSQTRDRRREKMDWAAPGQARLGEHDGLVGWINKRSIVAQAPARPEGLQQLQASRAVPRPWEGPLGGESPPIAAARLGCAPPSIISHGPQGQQGRH